MNVSLVDHVRAYMAEHHLSGREMAHHAGVPLGTLNNMLYRSMAPRSSTAAMLESAIRQPPPARNRKPPRHAEIVKSEWGRQSSTEIGRSLDPPISGARVRAIAKQIGLTGAPPAE